MYTLLAVMCFLLQSGPVWGSLGPSGVHRFVHALWCDLLLAAVWGRMGRIRPLGVIQFVYAFGCDVLLAAVRSSLGQFGPLGRTQFAYRERQSERERQREAKNPLPSG